MGRTSAGADLAPAPPQGVQLLLDGVTSYLPCPLDVESYALDAARGEEQVRLLKSRSGALPASCFLPPVWCCLLHPHLSSAGMSAASAPHHMTSKQRGAQMKKMPIDVPPALLQGRWWRWPSSWRRASSGS
jgi:hypothetical protein